ncbi:uncharacterized protein si:dkey-191g9.7 [Cheilinus undulatus]|uniref:uncharacterized protein si:dkey-191g9.7 n=1 Tax=Cheilinus undulatus TaxID=241271 RepID=UPI001BD538CC|nr:uncharacterized protein si:dkey-191g9.7 [Cheilinus undulatus]
MAEAELPALELHPLGTDVSLESTVPNQLLFDPPPQTATPSRQAGEPGTTCQEEPKKVVTEVCKENTTAPPTREIKHNSLKVNRDSGLTDQNPPEHCVPPRTSNHLHNLAKMQTASHQHNIAVNAINENSQAGMTLQTINPSSLPVHRSHSDTLPMVREGVPPPAAGAEACGLACHGGDHFVQEAHICPMLSCKQPMELQQCNIIPTFPNSGEGSVAHPQSRCVCASETAAKEKGQPHAKCDKVLCCGSYINHANFEDTFAAYCHPQPIPAPSQLLPRLAGAEASCDIQRAVEPPSAINHLTLPRLISSVSETGLDAKHLLRCCNLNCSWVSNLPPGSGPQSQKHFGLEECCSSTAGLFRAATREMGTMTAHKELRDVGVQTGQTVTPHVFPEICLAEESRGEISHSQTLTVDSNGDKKPGGAPKSPVKEVKWDAEGMTWEVYGASVDPEELGLAIQRHLELQIRETANHAAKLSRQNTNTSRQSGNNGCQGKRSRMMGSFRTPACCSRTTTAVD